MMLDMIHGKIARRILLNYRIDPSTLAKVLPVPFRPKLYNGVGIGGVCMIRFEELRPRLAPVWAGLRSENAAHRIAVEWEQDGEQCEGVFIPRRHTNSRFNKLLGGRVFPGIFTQSDFRSTECADTVELRVSNPDGPEELSFAGKVAESLMKGSVFPDLPAAAGFFALGATGYSATCREGHYHGMELLSLNWNIEPLEVEFANARYFNDLTRFPTGSIELDNALLMRNVQHEWHSRPDLYYDRVSGKLTTKPTNRL